MGWHSKESLRLHAGLDFHGNKNHYTSSTSLIEYMDCNVNVINKDIDSRFADTDIIVQRLQSHVNKQIFILVL